MKRKLLILLISAVLVLMCGIVPASAAINSISTDTTDGNDPNQKFTTKLNPFLTSGGVRILEADVTINEDGKSGGVVLSSKDGVLWYPVYYNGSANKLLVASDGTGVASAKKAITPVAGETYKIIAVFELGSTAGKADVYLNGERISETRTSSLPTSRSEAEGGTWWRQLRTYKGTTAIMYQPENLTSLADFSLDVWQGKVTSVTDVTVDNDRMVINAGRAPLSASEFLTKLTLPSGSSAMITLNGTEVSGDTVLTSGMLLDVTLQYGNKISYTLSAGFIPLVSDVYDVSLSYEGDVPSGKISGIQAYTPVSELTENLILGQDGETIGAVEPVGDFVEPGMKLAVTSVDGDTIYYDLELVEGFAEFEDYDGLMQIKGLVDKINGKLTLISGSIDIPEGGLLDDAKLYYEMDITRGYPVEFLADGTILVWGNCVGEVERGKNYDYVIITDSVNGETCAYINGVKVLSGAGLNNQFNSESNPYELVGENYNPCEFGDFLLTEIYSLQHYDEFYTPNLAMLSGGDEKVDIVHDGLDNNYLNLFVDEAYTLGDLADTISSMGEGIISYIDKNGNENTEFSTTIDSLGAVYVTSQNERYTTKYDLVITQDILKGEGLTVDLDNKTIGEILNCTPIDVFMSKLVVRPDYEFLGIYRNGEKINTGVIAKGDVLKLKKNDSEIDYEILIAADMVETEGGCNITGGTKDSVTVVEGTFTVPANGNYSDIRMRFHNPNKGSDVASFLEITASGFTVWKTLLTEVSAGERYTFAILNDHKACRSDVYLNGVKVLSNQSTTTWLLTNEEFTKLITGTAYRDYITDFRFYKVYSAADFVYENNLEILAVSPNTVSKNPNGINISDASVKTIADLMEVLSFPTDYIKDNAYITGNSVKIADKSTLLRNDMVLTVTSKAGLSAEYDINLAKMPITSYVFDVSDNTIFYNGNLTHDDFVRYILPADNTEIVVKDALGNEVSSGQLESGMTITAGEKTYTLNLTNTTTLPVISVSDIADEEIYKTTDTYTKSLMVSGEGITDVVAYLDGKAVSIGNTAGSHTFNKTGLTTGRHEIYFAAYTSGGKTETDAYCFYAFENETERLRAARQPVVMDINYLDNNGVKLAAGEKVSYEKTAAIELVFNKKMLESSVNAENIAIYDGEKKVAADISYAETAETAYYAAIITLGEKLNPSTKYKLLLNGNISDSDGNIAKDNNEIYFNTENLPFDILEESTVAPSGRLVTDISGGDSIVQRVELANTSLEDKTGVIVLAVFDGERMVGYSLSEFTLPKCTVSKTVTTDAAEISDRAGENLTVYRYIWDDINDMQTLLTASEATYK